jgi:hypothetical protein
MSDTHRTVMSSAKPRLLASKTRSLSRVVRAPLSLINEPEVRQRSWWRPSRGESNLPLAA